MTPKARARVEALVQERVAQAEQGIHESLQGAREELEHVRAAIATLTELRDAAHADVARLQEEVLALKAEHTRLEKARPTPAKRPPGRGSR